MAQEESEGLEKLYAFFRALVYVSVVIETAIFVPREWLGEANIVLDKLRPYILYQNVIFSKLCLVLKKVD